MRYSISIYLTAGVKLAIRRRQSRRGRCAALLVPLATAVLSVLAGCGSADSAPVQETSSSSRPPEPAGQRGRLNRCALLHDDEIQAAIGPHSPGSSEISNLWGLQSCRWKATTAQKSEAYPQGWF